MTELFDWLGKYGLGTVISGVVIAAAWLTFRKGVPWLAEHVIVPAVDSFRDFLKSIQESDKAQAQTLNAIAMSQQTHGDVLEAVFKVVSSMHEQDTKQTTLLMQIAESKRDELAARSREIDLIQAVGEGSGVLGKGREDGTSHA